MIRKHKKYARPRKAFDKHRIDEEVQIKQQFGLKNKREIWKAEAKVAIMRRRAKELITASSEEKEKFFEKLRAVGLPVKTISDVLALTKEDILRRRLQTVVHQKKLAQTSKGARQLITHKKVLVEGKVVNAPSYLVPTHSENLISVKPMKMRVPVIEKKVEEIEA
jgi:small subunit ribosomal protein S4